MFNSCFPVPSLNWSFLPTPPSLSLSSSLALLNIKHAVVCFMLLATHYGLMFKRLLTGFSRSSISS